MSKRSFLRGFGTGVLFATIILGISCLIRTSDAAVIKRARMLGLDYVREEPLFSGGKPASGGSIAKEESKAASSNARGIASKEKKTSKQAEASPKKSQQATASPAPKKDAGRQTLDRKEAQKEKASIEKEKDSVEKEWEAAEKRFTIEAGEWSSDVSRKLEEKGIVSNASDFDRYLEQNGYSDDIKAGSFTFSADDSYDKIAKAITGR